jgi:hypothetical protein
MLGQLCMLRDESVLTPVPQLLVAMDDVGPDYEQPALVIESTLGTRSVIMAQRLMLAKAVWTG